MDSRLRQFKCCPPLRLRVLCAAAVEQQTNRFDRFVGGAVRNRTAVCNFGSTAVASSIFGRPLQQ